MSQILNDKKVVARSIREFGWAVFERLRARDAGLGGNLCLSPAMLAASMALALVGAQDETAAELVQALRIVLPELQHHVALAAMLQKLGLAGFSKADGAQVLPANKIWSDVRFKYMKDFEKAATTFFTVTADTAAFAERAVEELVRDDARLLAIAHVKRTKDRINAWVATRTKGKITQVLPPNSVSAETQAILTSALYFRGQWRDVFLPQNSVLANFVDLKGKVHKDVPMMRSTTLVRYKKAQGYEAIELPYGPEFVDEDVANLAFAAVFVVPDSNTPTAFAALVRDLEGPGFNVLVDEMFPKTVDITLPKFRMSHQLALRDLLRDLGVSRVFDPEKAQLARLSPEKVVVSEMFHKTTFEVDEVHMTADGRQPRRTSGTDAKTFTADRPFLFFVWHKTLRMVMLVGQYVAPPSA